MSHPLSPHHLFCLNLHLHALIPCIYTFFLSFFQNWKLDSSSCPDRNLKTNRFVNFSSAFSHCGPLWSTEPPVWPHLSLCTLPLQSRRGPELIPEVSQSEPSLTLWLQYLTLLYFSISIIKLEYIWTQFVMCFHAFLSKKLFFLKLEKFLWLVLLFLFYVLVSICKIFTNLLLCQLIISPMFSILLISFCLFPYSLCCKRVFFQILYTVVSIFLMQWDSFPVVNCWTSSTLKKKTTTTNIKPINSCGPSQLSTHQCVCKKNAQSVFICCGLDISRGTVKWDAGWCWIPNAHQLWPLALIKH